MLNARLHRGRLAVVAAKSDDLHALVAACDFFEPITAAVRGAVIDKHHLPRTVQARQNGRELLIQERNVLQLITYRDDDGNSHRRPASTGCGPTAVECTRGAKSGKRRIGPKRASRVGPSHR